MSEPTKFDVDSEGNTTKLAAVLGLSGRRIQQLTQDGILVPVRRGVFQLGDSVQRYISFLSEGDKNEKKAKTTKDAAEALLKSSKARIAKMEADELDGKMHRSEDVAAMTEDLIYSIRSAFLALPGRLAVDVAAVDNPAEASEIIRRAVYEAMADLANYEYDPKKYAERVRERRKWDEAQDDDEAE